MDVPTKAVWKPSWRQAKSLYIPYHVSAMELYNSHQSIASLQKLKAIRKLCLIVSGWIIRTAVGEYSKLLEELSNLIDFLSRIESNPLWKQT